VIDHRASFRDFLLALGLPANWTDEISDEFILRALDVAERYRPALEELGKR
jgi:hypothetical protein